MDPSDAGAGKWSNTAKVAAADLLQGPVRDIMLRIFELQTAARLDGKGMRVMETLKQEALSAIAELPDSADIDEILYHLYVIDKVRKGEEAIKRGEYATVDDLKREIESW